MFRPADVSEVEAEAATFTTPQILAWQRTVNGRQIRVMFVPSNDPKIRAKQEKDVLRHLNERSA